MAVVEIINPYCKIIRKAAVLLSVKANGLTVHHVIDYVIDYWADYVYISHESQTTSGHLFKYISTTKIIIRKTNIMSEVILVAQN